VRRRRGELFVPSIVLDRGSSTPLHQQLGGQIARAIKNGVPSGARLPSTRVLARLLGVSRNTVMTAYDELAASGLIHGRQGTGMLVSVPARGAHPFDPRLVLRDAQYPAKTLHIVDPDGASMYLSFR
jgi:GntR family transcriptional regulator / MocR family aminotransferase